MVFQALILRWYCFSQAKNHFTHTKLQLVMLGMQFSPSPFGRFWLILQGPRVLKNKCKCSGKLHALELSNILLLLLWKWKLDENDYLVTERTLTPSKKFKQQHFLNFTNIIELFQHIFSNVPKEAARNKGNFETKIHAINNIGEMHFQHT